MRGATLNESGIDAASHKIFIAGGAGKETCIGPHWPDLDLATGFGELCCRFGSTGGVNNEFGDHRIVMRGDFTAFLDAAVDADVFRQAQAFQSSN